MLALTVAWTRCSRRAGWQRFGNCWKPIRFSGRTAAQAVGYREIIECLQGKQELRQTLELVKRRTRQFARRQDTWFRSLSECRRLEPVSAADPGAVAEQILEAGGGRGRGRGNAVKELSNMPFRRLPMFSRRLQETCYRGWRKLTPGFRPRGKPGCGFPQVLGVSWLLKGGLVFTAVGDSLQSAGPRVFTYPPHPALSDRNLSGSAERYTGRTRSVPGERGRELSDVLKQPDDAYCGEELLSNPKS